VSTGTEERIHYHDDLNFDATKNDIVIIDEADYFIYEDPEAFFKFQANK